jgi:predicted nucleic acid-binding protein
MPEIIISDTSCLITLSKINKLDILQKLYTTVFITEDVLNEIKASGFHISKNLESIALKEAEEN